MAIPTARTTGKQSRRMKFLLDTAWVSISDSKLGENIHPNWEFQGDSLLGKGFSAQCNRGRRVDNHDFQNLVLTCIVLNFLLRVDTLGEGESCERWSRNIARFHRCSCGGIC